jgi:hypothetical protein
VSDIQWTKTYDLKVDGRHFRVFVSEHSEGGFHASCLWYEKGRMLKAPGQFGSVVFELEQRYAATEATALGAIEEWVKTKFGDGFNLVQSRG